MLDNSLFESCKYGFSDLPSLFSANGLFQLKTAQAILYISLIQRKDS